MISPRDLLALSIIGARHQGVAVSSAERALDRLDDEAEERSVERPST